MGKRALALILLLASALMPAASSVALPDASNIETEPPRRADIPATQSLWDSPQAAAVVAVPAEQKAAVEPEPTPSANPLWAIPLSTLSNTRGRPIFSPSRRPAPSAAAPVVQGPPPPKPAAIEQPPLSLVGTVLGSEQSLGIFIDQSTKAALRLKTGEEYHGWTLRDVQPREAALERDQRTVILNLPQPEPSAVGPVQVGNAGDDAADRRERLNHHR
jgi:general secretion pathway protein N